MIMEDTSILATQLGQSAEIWDTKTIMVGRLDIVTPYRTTIR